MLLGCGASQGARARELFCHAGVPVGARQGVWAVCHEGGGALALGGGAPGCGAKPGTAPWALPRGCRLVGVNGAGHAHVRGHGPDRPGTVLGPGAAVEWPETHTAVAFVSFVAGGVGYGWPGWPTGHGGPCWSWPVV